MKKRQAAAATRGRHKPAGHSKVLEEKAEIKPPKKQTRSKDVASNVSTF